MVITTFASGSKGNCCFVKAGDTALLIDAGISFGRIKKNLAELCYAPEDLQGVRNAARADTEKENGQSVFKNRRGAHAAVKDQGKDERDHSHREELNAREAHAVTTLHEAVDHQNMEREKKRADQHQKIRGRNREGLADAEKIKAKHRDADADPNVQGRAAAEK